LKTPAADRTVKWESEDMERMMKRLANLISVKSIVTVVLTLVFSYLAVCGEVTGREFITVFSVIIAFYFGTQSQKISDMLEKVDGDA